MEDQWQGAARQRATPASLLADANRATRSRALLAVVAEAVWKPVARTAAGHTAGHCPRGVSELPAVPGPADGGRARRNRALAVSYLPSASTMTLLGEAAGDADLFLGRWEISAWMAGRRCRARCGRPTASQRFSRSGAGQREVIDPRPGSEGVAGESRGPSGDSRTAGRAYPAV